MMETIVIDRSSLKDFKVLRSSSLASSASASLWEKEGGKGWDTKPPWFNKIDQNW